MKYASHRSKNPIYHINDISNFMFTKDNIQNLLANFHDYKKEKKTKDIKTEEKVHITKREDYILPKYDDKLFWCWMIFFYGMVEYEFTQNNNWQRESLEKIKMVEDIRKHKQLLKTLKIKRTQIEAELTSQSEISISIILVLCAINNYNLVYIRKKMYYKYETESPQKTLYIFDDGSGAQIYVGDKEEDIENKCINLWRIYDLKKPLKALTTYKLRELQKISEILGLPVKKPDGKKKTKKVLYQTILTQI